MASKCPYCGCEGIGIAFTQWGAEAVYYAECSDCDCTATGPLAKNPDDAIYKFCNPGGEPECTIS